MTNTQAASTSKVEKSYNGWKNRSTWNVALWLNNDEYYYGAMQNFVSRARVREDGEVTARLAASFVKRTLGWTRTPDGDRMGSVDWPRIAEMMEESYPRNQCAFEDGMVTYLRCTNRVAKGEGLCEGLKVYCENHTEFEPMECDECDGETSIFQQREGTHDHVELDEYGEEIEVDAA